MKIFLIILFIFLTFKILNFFAKNKRTKTTLLRVFRSGNVAVAGHKGNGKDMLFYNVIRLREKQGEKHSANIVYTSQTRIKPVKYYCLHNNNLNNFISNKFNNETKLFQEKEDYYISDAGLDLPAWKRQTLEKEFDTLPIVYALSRQLADFSIHANAQTYNLIWDKLRYQANYFITCTSCKVFLNKFVKQKFIIYNRRQSAEDNILPFKVRRNLLGLRNRNDLEHAHLFNSSHGYIEEFTLYSILPKKGTVMYDTRQYHKYLYNEPAPKL